MADDVLVPGTGTTLAFDELTTVNGVTSGSPLPKAQRIKVVHGIDGVGTDASDASPLPTIDAASQAILAAAKTDLDGLLAAAGTTADTSTAVTLIGLLKAVKASLASTIVVNGSAVTQPVSLATNMPDITDRAARLLGVADLAAAAPLTITNAATVSASKYIGVSVRETSNTTTAVVRVRNLNVSGVLLDTISLQPFESISYTYPRGRAVAGGTVFIEVVSGTVEGSVFTL